jgi:hypothetical protein
MMTGNAKKRQEASGSVESARFLVVAASSVQEHLKQASGDETSIDIQTGHLRATAT